MAASRVRNRLGVRRGLTLIELSLSMTIMVLLLGAVLALLLQGVRMYPQVAASDWARFDAATAVARMEEEIEQSFRVTGRYSDRITITRPLLALVPSPGLYVPVEPLTAGDKVRYYLADATGTWGTNGTYLWRAVRPAGQSTYVPGSGPLARTVDLLQFTYEMMPAPRQASVAYVNVLVRAKVKEGATTRTRTHTSRIGLRNSGYGPVTAETGIEQGGE